MSKAIGEKEKKMKKDGKEKDMLKKIKEMPSLWEKCPKCGNIGYAKEVEKTNTCYYCKYYYPYPVAKVRAVENFRKTNPTWNDFGKVVIKILNTINDADQKNAFMGQVLGIAARYHERFICSACSFKNK